MPQRLVSLSLLFLAVLLTCAAITATAEPPASAPAAPEETVPSDDAPAENAPADAAAAAAKAGDESEPAPADKPITPPKSSVFGDPPGAKRLMPEYDVWVDPVKKRVIIDGEVCLREGQLEMFACVYQWVEDKFSPSGKSRQGTKEHESIVTLNTKAFVAHAALLSVGAEAGEPVRFAPNYTPATGTEVEVFVLWKDKQGKKHTTRAQDWIRDTSTKKAMTYNWIFSGSGFWTDEQTGERHYQAEGGDFICVSNFPSAMLDLPVESPQANQGLLFEAFTERIPPLRTPVRVVLAPKLKPAATPKAAE